MVSLDEVKFSWLKWTIFGLVGTLLLGAIYIYGTKLDASTVYDLDLFYYLRNMMDLNHGEYNDSA